MMPASCLTACDAVSILSTGQKNKSAISRASRFAAVLVSLLMTQPTLAQMVLNPLQTMAIKTDQDAAPYGAFPIDMEVDNAGNMISLGDYNPQILQPISIYNDNYNSQPRNYIMKFGPNGQALWGKNLSSTQVQATDVDSDNGGNIYVTGTVNGTDVFLSKTLSDGTPGLFITLPGTASEYYTVSLATNGTNIYLLRTTSSAVVVDPANSANTGSGRFLSVYNSSLQFIQNIPLPLVNVMAFTLDGSGNIFVTGTFSGTVDFNLDANQTNNLSANTSGTSSQSLFVAKYSAAGTFMWADKMGDPVNKALPSSIYADPAGNLYLAGPFSGTITTAMGGGFTLTAIGSNPNLFAMKIPQSGGTAFSFNIPTNISSNTLQYSNIQKQWGVIRTDVYGDVYLAGTFAGTVDFDPYQPVYPLTQNTFMYFGGASGFISKFTGTGQFLWASLQSGERMNSFEFDSNRNLIVQVLARGKYVPQVSIFKQCEPPTISLTSSSSAVCQQSNVTLTASGGSSYAWFGSNVFSPTATKTINMCCSGDQNLTVTGVNAHGCKADATVKVTVYPTPNVFISAGALALCEGTSTTLTANGASTYVWSPSTGLSGTTGNQVTATPLTNTTYSVVGTSTDGCQATGTVSITVRPKALVLSANKSSICYDAQNPTGANNAVVLSASGSSSAANYTWSKTPNTGSSVPPVGSTQYTDYPLGTTTYTVTALTNLNACQETRSINVPVFVPALSVNITSATVCAGASVSIGASGATSYLWSPAAGLSSTTAANVTASPTSTTTYTVTGPDVNGCSSSKNVAITVNPLPAVPSITGSSNNICAGLPTLTSSPANSYLWSTGATSSSIQAGAGGSYSVTVTNSSGCSSVSSPFTVYDKRPYLSVLPTTILSPCPPSGRLTASSGASYQWLRNGTPIGGNVNYFDITRGGTYAVSITNPEGCSGVTLTTSSVYIEDKFPGPIPTQYTCPATTLSLAATPSGGTWSGPGVSGSTFYSTTAGTYNLTYTVNFNGCVQSAPATVIVNQGPVITSFQGTSSVCPGNSYTYRVYTSGTVTSIQWEKPANWSIQYQSGNEITLYVPSYNPDYGTVRATVSDGSCSAADGMTVSPSWSCGSGGYYYSAYPNPTSSELTVESKEAVDEPTYLTMFDQFGKEAYIASIKAGEHQARIITDNLAPGIYWLEFRSSKRRELKKIVVVHSGNKN